jgi:cytochrome c oxidase assembly protein subunit 17
MDNTPAEAALLAATPKPKKLGPCCVCKETKKVRDECLLFKTEEDCQQEIFKHNACLKEHGFEPAK